MPRTKERLYKVEAILASQQVEGRTYYLTKWKGYPICECTWESANKISKDLISEFKRGVKKYIPDFNQLPDDQPPPIEDFIDIPTSKQKSRKSKSVLDLVLQLKSDINVLKLQTRQILDILHSQVNEVSQTPSPEPAKKVDTQEKPQSEEKSKETPNSPISPLPEQIIVPDQRGSFEQGDTVEKIGRAGVVKETDNKFYYVLWNKRGNGITPKNTWISSDILKQHDCKVLCQYLRSKLPI